MKLSGLTAVVTGAASGLGAATAAVLHEAGARVALLDRNREGAQARAEALGDGTLALACDVTDGASIDQALDAATEGLGPVRVAVNCAGVVGGARFVGRDGAIDLDGFRRIVEINLMGTVAVMSRAAARMATLEPLGPDGERGVIVNTGSIAAFEGQIGQGAYAASKGGVASLTLPAAREFKKLGIRVLCIAPGVFETPMISGGMSEEIRAALVEKCQFPARLGQPEEYGRLVKAICEIPMLNGSVLRLDGAQRLEPK